MLWVGLSNKERIDLVAPLRDKVEDLLRDSMEWEPHAVKGIEPRVTSSACDWDAVEIYHEVVKGGLGPITSIARV